MTTQVTTQPSTEPIALADAARYLRIDYTADNSFITSCIQRARRKCEDITGLRMYTQVNKSVVETDKYVHGRFSGIVYDSYNDRYNAPIRLYLPYSPVTSISSISYESDFNVWTSIDPVNFNIDYDDLPCSFVLQRGIELHAMLTEQGTYRFKVVYTVGYTDITAISPTIIDAMYKLMASYYTNRDDTCTNSAAIEMLLSEKIYLL